MYPPVEVLQEIGRVTIAGSRLDLRMGMLWWHLDLANVDEVDARKAPGSEQAEAIRRLANQRLGGALRAQVLRAVDEAAAVRELRNQVVHQDWVLRGADATRPVGELANIGNEDDVSAYLDEWERDAKESADWFRVPGRELALIPRQPLDELREVEGNLAATTARITGLTFIVASARETGHPDGWATNERPAR